jgi:hypothetical protein
MPFRASCWFLSAFKAVTSSPSHAGPTNASAWPSLPNSTSATKSPLKPATIGVEFDSMGAVSNFISIFYDLPAFSCRQQSVKLAARNRCFIFATDHIAFRLYGERIIVIVFGANSYLGSSLLYGYVPLQNTRHLASVSFWKLSYQKFSFDFYPATWCLFR